MGEANSESEMILSVKKTKKDVYSVKFDGAKGKNKSTFGDDQYYSSSVKGKAVLLIAIIFTLLFTCCIVAKMIDASKCCNISVADKNIENSICKNTSSPQVCCECKGDSSKSLVCIIKEIVDKSSFVFSLFCFLYFIILIATLIVLFLLLINNDSGLKFAKLNAICSMESRLLQDEYRRNDDLLKHYMTCVTEI